MTKLITKITADNIDTELRRYEADTQVLACHNSVRKALLKKMIAPIALVASATAVLVFGPELLCDSIYNMNTMYADSFLTFARQVKSI